MLHRFQHGKAIGEPMTRKQKTIKAAFELTAEKVSNGHPQK
jgi:hypothetical protein